GGNVLTNSYDSTTMTSATPAPTIANGLMSNSGGDVGTNGNLSVGGSATINGNLYTPRAGVGSCASGAVTAVTESGHADVPENHIMHLPAPIVYPPPPVPTQVGGALLPLADLSSGTGACAKLGLTVANCSVVAGAGGSDDVVIDTNGGPALSLPSVHLTGKTNIIMIAHSSPAAEYNFNSVDVASQSAFGVKATSPTQGVLVNVVGKDNTGAAIPI